MKYLSHIPALILASGSPSCLLIFWFLMHIICLQGERAWSGQPGINFWSPGNYISHSKLLSWLPDFIHQPVESFDHVRNLPRNLLSTQEYQQYVSFWILEPKDSDSPRCMPPSEPSSDQLPNCAAPSVDDHARKSETFCGWSTGPHTKDNWSIEQKGQALGLDKPVVKSWLSDLLPLLFNLWLSIFSFTKWKKSLGYESVVLKVEALGAMVCSGCYIS